MMPANAYAVEKEYVILLHGINRSSSSMEKFEKHFQKNNYNTLNVDYASRKYTIEVLAERLDKKIKATIPKNAKINFVTHSMGGLLARYYIEKHQPKNLNRVVLVAPPNHGSEMADYLMNNAAYQVAFGPAGQQLGTGKNSISNKLLKTVDYNVGVIAANETIDPLSSYIIPGDDDGKVSIESTKIKGMKDHIILDTDHLFIVVNKDAMKQSLYFLKNGKFDKAQ